MASDRDHPTPPFRPQSPQAGVVGVRRRRLVSTGRSCSLRADPPRGGEPQLRGGEGADPRMSPGLNVLAPGFHTTVQDLGRIGYQDMGVPVSGALDGVSLRVANALVGNPLAMPGLEILLSGPTLEVAADSGRVALLGAGGSLRIGREDPLVIPAGQSVILPGGEVFEVVASRHSACCCLAVEGGIAVPLVLGSASTYARAAIGGFEGRALRREDVVPLAIAHASQGPELRAPTLPSAGGEQSIRVIPGPQPECFTAEAVTG